MRLWFDVQALQGPFFERGIQRYVRSVAIELERRSASIAGFGLNPTAGPVRPFHAEVVGSAHLRTADAANLRAAAADGDLVYLCGSAFEGFQPIQNLWPNYLVIPEVPAYAIVYDTIPFRRPEEFQATHERRRFYAARRHLLERADGFLAISRSSADDLLLDLELGDQPVRVIGCGVDRRFVPADDPEGARRAGVAGVPALREGCLLYVGGFQPQKNVERLIDAYALLDPELRAAHQLVIGGKVPDEQLGRWQALCERRRIEADVVFTGLVSDELLLALYQCARLLVFPSLHEGFGLPVAEAIACGTPAIVADASSLPEVIGWQPGMFDPLEVESIAALITRALTDDAFDAELRAACASAVGRHTWPRVVDALLDALPAGGSAGRRRRLAVVDDSPERSTIASGALVGAIGDDWTIDWFSDRPSPPVPGVFPRRSWGRTAEPSLYDAQVTTAELADDLASVVARLDVRT